MPHESSSPAPYDLLIEAGTIVTMNSGRAVLDDAWLAIRGSRIAAIGSGQPPAAHRRLGGRGFLAMPGLIDAHSHAGHGLVRAAGGNDGNTWFDVCEALYAHGSTPGFWHAEACLALLERLQAGVTTAVSLLGGGGDIMRTDSPEAGDAHSRATEAAGLRTLMAVGPGRRPFPKSFTRIDAPGGAQAVAVDFATQMAVCETLLSRWNDAAGRGAGSCLTLPVYGAADMADPEAAGEIRAMAEQLAELRARFGVLLTQDGHRAGSIALAQELGLLGRHAALSHSVDLSAADIAALQASGASVIHNPSAMMSLTHRCPVPELIAAGVNVCLGSDAGAPDRGFDMFRHMKQAMLYHRRHFRDLQVLPEGKALEMVTIDAARALGLEHELGSLEPGKKADVVLLDMRKPHLFPPVMPVLRLTHFANAADVDTVVVNGEVLMQARQASRVDVGEVLDTAEAEARRAFERAGMADLRAEAPGIWGVARQHDLPLPASPQPG